MAQAVNIDLSGFAELEEALRTLGPRVARKVGAKAMKRAAQVIVDEAKTLVPVRTGELEDSITTAPQRSNVDRELKIAIGFKPPASRYAHLVEFGTSHSAAQPFMRPALDSKAESAIAVMGAEIWKGIEAEARKATKGKQGAK